MNNLDKSGDWWSNKSVLANRNGVIIQVDET